MDSDKKQLDLWDHTIDLSSLNLSSTFDYGSLSNTIISQSHTGRYTYDTGSITMGTPTLSAGTSGTLQLDGDNADIVVNGVSLMDKINAIADRLNILDVNKELEAEWDQLRELREQYQQLEQELKTKSAMWKTLKTKPPRKPRS
jgi:hypothetical protein